MFEEVRERNEERDMIECLNENKKFDLENYIMLKMRLESKCMNRVSILRKMYRDYDIGCKNMERYKVIKGKKWFRKCDRKK